MSRIITSLLIISAFTFTFNASACDDKSCEVAYLSAAQQYKANHIRRAEAFRLERHAYSMNRQRRAYALYVHLHLMLHGYNMPIKQLG